MTALKDWMDKRGLADADVASRIEGLSRSQVSRIRRGVSRPSPATAEKLAALTRIPAAKFIFGERR
jgi:transcriptional regulator with XRE-family HTH domain